MTRYTFIALAVIGGVACGGGSSAPVPAEGAAGAVAAEPAHTDPN
jgi:hypothetical protein